MSEENNQQVRDGTYTHADDTTRQSGEFSSAQNLRQAMTQSQELEALVEEFVLEMISANEQLWMEA